MWAKTLNGSSNPSAACVEAFETRRGWRYADAKEALAMLNKKNETRKGSLGVLLLGEDERRRAEIKAALENLGDPPLEIVSVTPQGGAHESSNGVRQPRSRWWCSTATKKRRRTTSRSRPNARRALRCSRWCASVLPA